MIRKQSERWFEAQQLFSEIAAEFKDSALLKLFGRAGEGVIPVPSAIEETVIQPYGVECMGHIPEVVNRFYAISVEKRVQQEATLAMVHQARDHLFDEN